MNFAVVTRLRSSGMKLLCLFLVE